MCGTCGCADGSKATIINLQTGEHVHMDSKAQDDAPGAGAGHAHHHGHGHADHGHGHSHDHSHVEAHSHGHEHHDHAHPHAAALGTTVQLEQAILQKNDELAARNRAWFQGREILSLNLVSSPGSGKTSLLERSIVDIKDDLDIYVIEGDQQTANDAERIKASGAPSVQINTGTGCHLEADMVMQGLRQLKPKAGSIVMIENVGNLVCPALFDLGETAKVAILSVTEGEDKPIKYPHMFQASSLMILNKIDLLPHVDFDVERCFAYAKQVNPDIEILQLSARSGEGLDSWHDWLKSQSRQVSEKVFA